MQTFEQALLGSELFTSPASTADTFAEQIVTVVTRELDKTATLCIRSKRRSRNSTKWLSAKAVKAKRLRRRLEKRWITSGHNDDRMAYRQACRKANRLINESRRSYRNEMIDGCTDSKKRWAAIKKILHSSKRDIEDSDENNKKRCPSFC